MLDAYYTQRLYQVENSPFSETFEIVGTDDTFNGIFDRAHQEESRSGGGVSRKTVGTRIMVATIPDALDGLERAAEITRVSTGETYKYNKPGKDLEGVPILWLV